MKNRLVWFNFWQTDKNSASELLEPDSLGESTNFMKPGKLTKSSGFYTKKKIVLAAQWLDDYRVSWHILTHCRWRQSLDSVVASSAWKSLNVLWIKMSIAKKILHTPGPTYQRQWSEVTLPPYDQDVMGTHDPMIKGHPSSTVASWVCVLHDYCSPTLHHASGPGYPWKTLFHWI